MRACLLSVLFAAPALAQDAANDAPTTGVDVSHTVSEIKEHVTEWTRWTDRVVQVSPMKCGTPEAICLIYGLVVENRTDRMLTCSGAIRSPQPNPHGIEDATESKVLVASGRREAIVAWAAPDRRGMTFESSCIPTEMSPPEPPPPPRDARKCRFETKRAPDVDSYYPVDARFEKREGAVSLWFTVPDPTSSPTDIEIDRGSDYPDLDRAALRALGTATMTTNCAGGRYRTTIRFAIKH